MERVPRMNTATSPKPARLSAGFVKANSLIALASAAAITLAAGLTLTVGAQEPAQRTIATGSGIPLAADAPDRYTVKQGDTLWDISQVFLRDPWFWPEIWYLNPQVKNPHLIYPGDVLALTSVEGQPQVTIVERGPEGAAAAEAAPEAQPEGEGPTRSGSGFRLSPRVRSTPITAAVTAIPYEAIAAFLGKPSILTKDQVKSGPYLMGVRDSHLIGGQDNEVYARGLRDPQVGTRYNYVYVDIPIRDPENNKLLGYRGIYSGSGVVMAPGNPAKLSVDRVAREVLRGDKLFVDEATINLEFLPHPAPEDMTGSIAALSDVMISGAYSVAAINRGSKHGIELGHVLAINQRGEKVYDTYKEGGKPSYWSFDAFRKRVQLPNERIGVLMVFKVFDNMSYALIMEATHPVRIGDMLSAP
jgi:LysM repeat protein